MLFYFCITFLIVIFPFFCDLFRCHLVQRNSKKHFHSLPFRVRDMNLHYKFSIQEYIIFSDGLFWICYPKSLRLPTMSEGSPAFLEVFWNLSLIWYVRSIIYLNFILSSILNVQNHINLCVFIGMEWLFEQLRNSNLKCCRTFHIKYWRRYLKDIKTMKFSYSGEDWRYYT